MLNSPPNAQPKVHDTPREHRQTIIASVALAALAAIFGAMACLGDLKLHVIETIALALAAGLVYFVALYALEHSRDSRAALWIIVAGAVLFRLMLLPLPPSLSTDMYRYRWDGKVQNAGWNPYLVAPLDPSLAAIRDRDVAVMPIPEMPAMYPPLAELIFRYNARLANRLATPGTRAAGIAFKLPFLLADLLVLALLAGCLRSAGARNYRLAVYAWSPLVIIEFAAAGIRRAGHRRPDFGALDSKVASRVVNACARLRRAGEAFSNRALADGAAFGRLAAAVARLGGCGASSALGLACLWPYRSAIHRFPQTFLEYQRVFQNYHASLYSIFLWFTGRPDIAAGIGEGVVLGLAIWVAWRKIDPTRAAFLLVGSILLLAPNGYSWYFTWIVPLLCFFPNPAWLLLTVLQLLSYKVLIDYQILGIWHFDPFFQWLTYGPFYALLIAGWSIGRIRERQAEVREFSTSS